MTKTLFWLVIIFTIFPLQVLAYLNCTPSACPANYADNGIVCSGSECHRNCTIEVCGEDWTRVWNQTIGFDGGSDDDDVSSASYSPTEGRCYNFTFVGPPSTSVTYIKLGAEGSPPEDCDTEGIGGFFDATSTNAPWFNTSSRYLGNVGNGAFNHLFRMVRGHTDASADDNYRASMDIDGSILCAPNSEACNDAEETSNAYLCQTDCYGRSTYMHLRQGYYVDVGDNDETLYNQDDCGGAYVGDNRLKDYQYVVSAASLTNATDFVSCDRIHEAPNATNVRILPENPNAGENLLCNYTYTDPENWTEQNSSYEWWKNGVSQNINEQVLSRTNLTPGDQWHCKVTPSDGMLFGNQMQSANTVTVKNATQNVQLIINGTSALNHSGYFGEEKILLDFHSQLASALDECDPDEEGYCTVSLSLSSSNVGTVNVSGLAIYYDSGNSAEIISLSIASISEIYSNLTMKLFEFVIYNDGTDPVHSISWQFDTGDGVIINSTQNISSLGPEEKAFVYLAYNYSTQGDHTVVANATGHSASGKFATSVFVGDLMITGFDDLATEGTRAVFETRAQNLLETTISPLNWSLLPGDGANITSQGQISLLGNETFFIYVGHDYGRGGPFTATSQVFSGSLFDSATTEVNVPTLRVQTLVLLNASGNARIVEATLNNGLSINLSNVTWSYDTKNANILNSTQGVVLGANESVLTYIGYNFTGAGTYNTNLTTMNGSLSDSTNLTLIIA